jgi:hypothetical protein
MDRWLPHVADLSFETVQLALSMSDAMLLRNCYKHLHGRTYYDDFSQPTSDRLPADLVAGLKELGERLRPAMQALGAAEDGIFAKLSGRSAKDAPLYTSRLDQKLKARLASSQSSLDDDHTLILGLFEAALDLMRVHEPASLLWMLINSQRVDEDLDVALRHTERWDQAIVLRRWWDGVSTDLEFRMFVNGGEATGLTQYNHLIFSPRVAAHGGAIAEALSRYYKEEVLPRLRTTPFYEAVQGRFTCDLALHPEALAQLDDATGAAPLTKEHIKLVELNCFYEATGMGLFDYHEDKQRLDHGPFEWRVRTEPLPHAAVKLEHEWREVLSPIQTPSAAADAPATWTTRTTRRVTDEALLQLIAAQDE